jgi:hypothetical protein
MIDAFLFYTLACFLLGVSAVAVILILYLKTRNRRLIAHLLSSLFLSLLIVILCFNLYNKKTGQFPALLKTMTDIIPLICCGLVCFWPRVFQPHVRTVDKGGRAFLHGQALQWVSAAARLLRENYRLRHSVLSYTSIRRSIPRIRMYILSIFRTIV